MTWNEEFELPGGPYSVSDVLEYFEYILKEHGEKIHHKNDPFNKNICKWNKKWKYITKTPRIFFWTFYA